MFHEIFSSYPFQIAIKNAAVIGILAGILGPFIVIKKQTGVINVISNGALIGILLSFIITNINIPYFVLILKGIMGILVLIFLNFMYNIPKTSTKAAQYITASILFGISIVLISYIQKYNSIIININKLLFGKIDIFPYQKYDNQFYICTGIFLVLLLFLNKFKATIFDENFSRIAKIHTKFYKTIFTLIVILVVVIGVETMGAVLIAGLFIIPSISARQWTNTFLHIILLSSLFGGISGTIGGLAYCSISNMMTGPAIIIVSGIIAVISFVFAPDKGIYWQRRMNK